MEFGRFPFRDADGKKTHLRKLVFIKEKSEQSLLKHEEKKRKEVYAADQIDS